MFWLIITGAAIAWVAYYFGMKGSARSLFSSRKEED